MSLIKKRIIQIVSDGSIVFFDSTLKDQKKSKFYFKDYKNFYNQRKNFKLSKQSLHYKKKYF